MPDPNVDPLGACPDLSLIAAYVDARLSDSERDFVHRHLASCDLCIELVTEVVAANEMALAPVAAPPEPDCHPAPRSVLPFLRRHRTALTGTLVAAAAALLLVLRIVLPQGSGVTTTLPAMRGGSAG